MKISTDHSFPDGVITNWESQVDELHIEISSVHFSGSPHKNAVLKFSNIRRFTCMQWNQEKEEWIEEQNIEPLKDIQDLHHKLNKFSLKGFGRNSGELTAIGITTDESEITWEK